MEIVVAGKRVKLSPKEVKLSKKISNDFFKTIKESCEKNKCPTLYYTFLVILHIMTGDQLSMFDSNVLQLLLSASAIAEENQRKNN